MCKGVVEEGDETMSEVERIIEWLKEAKCPLCGAELYTDGYVMLCSRRLDRGECTFRARLERY